MCAVAPESQISVYVLPSSAWTLVSAIADHMLLSKEMVAFASAVGVDVVGLLLVVLLVLAVAAAV